MVVVARKPVRESSSFAAAPVVGWMVDPSLELKESGYECAWRKDTNGSAIMHSNKKYQWRNEYYIATNDSQDAATSALPFSTVSDGRDDDLPFGDRLELAPAIKNKREGIFRNRSWGKQHCLTHVPSTDAITNDNNDSVVRTQTLHNEAEQSPTSNRIIVPSMIYLQPASSRDSVECVLADVFMIPSSSSTLTDDEFSVSTIDTILSDEQQLEEAEPSRCNVPSQVQAPTEQAIGCMLKDYASSPPDDASTSSSLRASNDSSDAEERMADLMSMMTMETNAYDDAWTAAKRGDLEALQQIHQQGFDLTVQDDTGCLPIFYACLSSSASSNAEAVRFLLHVHPTALPDDVYDRCYKNTSNMKVRKLLDTAMGDQGLSLIDVVEEPAVDASRAEVIAHGHPDPCESQT